MRKSKYLNTTKLYVLVILADILFAGCHRNFQDTPEDVVDTFAQSIASMDIESAVSCFEYGDEILSLMGGMTDNDFSVSSLQGYISAAKESQLLPDITYEIVSSEIHDEKGTVRVKFTYSFDDGETLHESSNEEVFPVYLHDGQWWIGEGFSKSEREMARRGMKFLEKIGSQKSGF